MSGKAVTRADVDALETIAWGVKHFGSLTTSRQFTRRKMDRLVRLGLAKSAGLCEPCDGDGFRTGGLEREGFVLTEAGAALVREAERAANAHFAAMRTADVTTDIGRALGYHS